MPVLLDAGKEGVAALNAVGEAMGDQEIQGAIEPRSGWADAPCRRCGP